MDKPKRTARNMAVGGVVIIAVSLLVWVRLSASSVEEGTGSIIALDLAERRASLEVVNPSTGKTRQYDGSIPPECEIMINGKAATLADLRVGDSVRVRASLERRSKNPGGKVKPYMTAQHVFVTRETDSGPAKK